MSSFPKSLHVVDVSTGRDIQFGFLFDQGDAADFDGPKQGYRSVSDAAIDWEKLARARTHPIQVSALEVLTLDGGREMSPSEIARELEVELNLLNYHVTELAKAGLVQLVREEQVRGATEHFYRVAA